MATTAIILAAGEGTRMKSKQPKVMHEMLGHPLVWWAVRSAKLSGIESVICVVGNGANLVRELFKDDPSVVCVEQTERKGTGHAVQTALSQLAINNDYCIVLNGDSPLIEPDTISSLTHKITDEHLSCAVLTMTPPCCKGYGRIATEANGEVTAIIEDKDCTCEQRESLHECNSGVYAFNTQDLKSHILELTANNAQGEYYLTDMIALLKQHNKPVASVHVDNYKEMLGVNSRSQLAEASAIMQMRINEHLMAGGVTMIDPHLVWVDESVTVGRDTVLYPMTFLMGDTHIGEDCMIGPNTRLTNTTVGNSCIVDETVAVDAVLENSVSCGPRAYLRPGTHMLDNSKAGTHVEIKNSQIGEGSKVPHLSYIGDTTMGSEVNIGAGAITCNYDGVSKHHTTIGDNVFIGSDTMMVAPVTIGDGALVGAASCITQDVPQDALALERSDQKVIAGYAEKRRNKLAKGKGTSNGN